MNVRFTVAAACAAILGFLAFLFCTAPVFAQTSLQSLNVGSGLTVSEDPQFPGPGQSVTLTAESPIIDIANSDVEWAVNGSPAGSGSSITIPLGGLGTQTNIALAVSGSSGSDETEVSITPTSIDLLYEADSFTPALYRGRALPSSGSMIRLMAIPHFVQSDGTRIPISSIKFTWKNNGATLSSISGVGKNTATIPAAILYGNDVITVDAQSTDGSLAGERTVSVQTQDPELILYEVSPLYGIQYERAISSSQQAHESESTFASVPYFADVRNVNDASLSYEWEVNGTQVAADSKDPSEITLQASGPETANVSLSLSKPSDPFVSASGTWTIVFSNASSPSSGSSAQSEPSDSFHTQ